jgi:muramidase (phage lysozyme)
MRYMPSGQVRASNSWLWAIASGAVVGIAGLWVMPYLQSPVVVKPATKSAAAIVAPAMPDEVVGWRIVRAYIRTIAFAEGTWYPGRKDIDAYRTQALSYRQIPLHYAFRDHPYWHDKIIPCAELAVGRVCSACTGALQWHPDTYDAVRDRWKDAFWFDDGKFSPRNQDLAGIYKLQELGVWQTLYSGIDWKQKQVVVSRKAFAQALSQSAATWASLPRYEGDRAGYHGQGARDVDKLYALFRQQLKEAN